MIALWRRAFHERIVSLLEIDWLGSEQYEAALHGVLIANRCQLSLVDCASFETMRRLRIEGFHL